ncbi:MAG: hypothetical protein KGP28_08110 [Bdellovibrionales bacterium]|nr:hypothetical protein [Bdellovibrionales bacterium]
MLRLLSTLSLLLLTNFGHANGFFDSRNASFEISPGKLHKGGSLTAQTLASEDPGVIKIRFEYEIQKKSLVPVPSAYLSGVYDQSLPAGFLEENGYLELEQAGAIETDDATIIHQGRVPHRNLSNAHLIQILPKNGRSEVHLVYHPSIPGFGWDEIKLILHTGIPLLGDYWIEGTLRELASLDGQGRPSSSE